LTDELPTGLTYISGVGSGWSCSSAQHVVTCVRPDPLTPAELTTVNLKVEVRANAASTLTHAPKVATEGDITASNDSALDTTIVAVPVVNARFIPQNFVAGDQPSVDLSLPSSFPHDIHGTLTLGFTPDAIHPVDDPAIQFSTGGRNLAFTIPANTVRARFGTNTVAGPIGFQAGTVAGNISFNGTLQTGNVETAFSSQTTIPKQAPKIHSVQRESTNGNNFLFGVRLTSSPREVTQLLLRFVGSQTRFSCGGVAGCSANGNSLTLDVRSMFDSWFIADTLNGSGSILHLPLYIDSGNSGTIEISLINRFGTSNVVRYTLP
ncbi:MAG TPA: hypothetical protein VFR18_08825, partial [Terriglobia bacterium]|nr:hypothetical protein [Terriglobia bacterium]